MGEVCRTPCQPSKNGWKTKVRKGLNVKFDGNRLACGGKELLAWARQIRDS